MSDSPVTEHVSSQALRGVRVVVTRAREQAGVFVDALVAYGATAVVVPVIAVVDPFDNGLALRRHLNELRCGDWLVLTSPNGAQRVGAVLQNQPLAQGVLVAAIGPGTMRQAHKWGIAVDLIPDASVAESLLAAFPATSRTNARVLLARAAQARQILPEGLRRLGWLVDDVAAYTTIGVEVSDADKLACRQSDIVAFTSSSTVRQLLAGVGKPNLPRFVAAIGPVTAATARELGLNVDVVANPHTIDGLVQALVNFHTRL